MRAVSISIDQLVPTINEDERAREREESKRLLAEAARTVQRANEIKAKVQRMTSLYRERLVGNRRPPRVG